MSVAKSYGEIVRRNATLPALLRNDTTIAHGDLWQIARSFAMHMRHEGVARSSIVVVNTNDVLVLIAAILATSLLGARIVMAGTTLARSKAISPTHYFRTEDSLGPGEEKFTLIDNSWLPSEATRADQTVFDGSSNIDDDWLYVHTTGSTGQPKFIALSERMVLDRSAAVKQDFPYREVTFATTFAVRSRPFIARAIAALLNACAICEGKNIDFWKACGVNLVCGAPGQIEHHFKDVEPRFMFEKVETSGALLPERVISHLFKFFHTVVDVYGATETNKSFETIYRKTETDLIQKTPNARDSEIQIVGADGEILGPGKIGTIRVRNSYLANGYLNDPVATQKSFRDGWFYPGDLAAWGENGELIIVGREDDVINIGGYKMNAGMLDMFFKKIPGIADAIAFNNPKIDAVNKVLVFAVFDDEQRKNEIIANVCELAAKQIGFLLVPSCIRSVRSIPRSEAGEPDRKACRRMVAQRAEIDFEDNHV